MIKLDFELQAEKFANIVGLEKIIPVLERLDSFVLGQCLAAYAPISILYKKSFSVAVTGVIDLPRFAYQAFNQEKIEDKLIIENQVEMRLFLMGWYSVRGLEVAEEDIMMYKSFTAIKIDFTQIQIIEREAWE